MNSTALSSDECGRRYTSSRATATASCSTAREAVSPSAIAATTSSQKTRPTTLARWTASRVPSGSPSSRASRTPVSVAGTLLRPSRSSDTCQCVDSGSTTIAPSSMSIFTTSSTKNGLPSVRSMIKSTSAVGTSSTHCRTSSTSSRVARSDSRSRPSRRSPGRPGHPGRRSSTLGRAAATTSRRQSARSHTNRSRRAIESSSAQCRSSTMITAGFTAVTARR